MFPLFPTNESNNFQLLTLATDIVRSHLSVSDIIAVSEQLGEFSKKFGIDNDAPASLLNNISNIINSQNNPNIGDKSLIDMIVDLGAFIERECNLGTINANVADTLREKIGCIYKKVSDQ